VVVLGHCEEEIVPGLAGSIPGPLATEEGGREVTGDCGEIGAGGIGRPVDNTRLVVADVGCDEVSCIRGSDGAQLYSRVGRRSGLA
jgi:hypothetical protein